MPNIVRISEVSRVDCRDLIFNRGYTRSPYRPEYANVWQFFDTAYDECIKYRLRVSKRWHTMRDDRLGEISGRYNCYEGVNPLTHEEARSELAWRVWCVAVRYRNLSER